MLQSVKIALGARTMGDMGFEGFGSIDWTGFALAAGGTLVAMLLLQPIAGRLGLVDVPTQRKDHGRTTPTTGGLAMMLGITLAALVVGGMTRVMGSYLVAAWLLIVTGWLDDRFDLRWYTRIGIQIAAALILIYGGGVRIEQLGPVFGFHQGALGLLSVPFTILATVGLINAINMIDGVDGLAGTLVMATLLMVVAAAIYSGNDVLVQRTLLPVAAVAAFLVFNFRFPWRSHAFAFMGNAGSAVLGLTLAWCCFRLSQNPGHPVSPVLALWLAPVPVIDCLVLIVRRLQLGRSPFSADHDHVHHIMRDAGFGPLTTSIGLAVFTLLCGLVVGQALRWDLPEPLLLAAYLAFGAGWYALTARRDRAVAFFRAARFWSRFLPDARAIRVI